MRRRILLAALAAMLLVAPIVAVAPATAQDTTSPSNTTVEQSNADYSLDELRGGGTTQEGAPPSMRFLGSYGSATLRHEPVGFGSSDWEYVSRDTRVQQNAVTLRTIRLGDPNEELTINVVGWQRGTRTVQTQNGTTSEPVAENVTATTVSTQLGRGYDSAEVPLPSSFGENQRVTMWVEEYPDARWTFEHRTIATARSIDINSWGDFLSTLFWEIGVFALPAMLIGGSLGRRHHEKAIVGPQWGLVKWGLAVMIPVALLASFFAFQGAVLATRLPAGMALVFGVLSYALVLEGSGPSNLQKFLFRRQDLESAKSPRGEDTHDSRYVDHVVKTGLRREADQELVLIRKGLPAYIARLRGSLATLDVSDIQTHKKGKESPYELEIELDPEWDLQDALVHAPPELVRLPLSREVDVPGIGLTTLPNPGVVLPLGGGAAAGWFISDAMLGIPGFGAVVGAIVGLPFIYRTENGGAESEPAPYHFTQAEASLAFEAGEYADAKLLDQYRDIAWRERMKTPLDARDIEQKFDSSVTRELTNAELGIDDDLDVDPETTKRKGVADDD
ncbi:hypothetical protein EXE53_21200 [Halorubrum sp. SD626R]|uniref:hypothetical protein n=1 Tax=Halorubrum sp. SD626R TaxID=1419722 RepID=UPI0010FA0009|nr:hypothetical protein [Halorubrum sp. SD626R]TKX78441.1 hypothetical protein EXE53_21200 [Halorubrum sp. SD626R]